MSDTLNDVPETPTQRVDELTEENSLPTLRPHPGTLTAIITVGLAAGTKTPEDLHFALYHATKQFSKARTLTWNSSDIDTVVFLHYIEAYRALMLMTDQRASETQINPTDPKYMRAYEEAALSLFDIYLTDPKDRIIRRVLIRASEAVFEVIAAHQAMNKDQAADEMMGNMATVALFIKTLSTYLRGSRRAKNLEYIAWLKTFFEQALGTTDLSFMREDPITKSVMTQVMAGKSVIDIPNT